MTTMDMDATYMFEVEHIQLDTRANRVADLKPIGLVRAGKAIPIDDQTRSTWFPKRGRVKWFRTELDLHHIGVVVLGNVETSPKGSDAYTDDLCLTTLPRPAQLVRIEHLDVPWLRCRDALLGLRFDSPGPVAFVNDDEELTPPFETVSENGGANVFSVAGSAYSANIKLGRLSSSHARYDIDGRTYVRRTDIVSTDKSIDLRKPEEILKTLIRQVLEDDQDFANRIGVARRRVDEFIAELQIQRRDGVDAYRNAVALDTLRKFSSHERSRRTLLEEFDMLPELQKRIERLADAREAEAQQQRQLLLRTAETQAESLVKEANRLLADASAQREAAIAQASEAFQAAQSRIAVSEREANERLANLQVDIDRATKELLDRTDDLNARPVSSPPEKPPHVFDALPDAPLIASIDLARQSFESRGIAKLEARALFAALLGRTLPVLFGRGQDSMVDRLAETVAGGRVHRVTIESGYMSLRDLLVESGSGGTVVPAGNGLLDTMVWAMEHPDRIAILSLEGIDRSEPTVYLAPLLECYRDRRPLPYVFLLDTNHPYRTRLQAPWPENLLLVSTTRDRRDPSRLPLPWRVWTHALPIDADASRIRNRRQVNEVDGVMLSQALRSTSEHRLKTLEEEVKVIEQDHRGAVPIDSYDRLRSCVGTDGAPDDDLIENLLARWVSATVLPDERQEVLEVLESGASWTDEFSKLFSRIEALVL